MKQGRFILDSNQLELLLAFEESKGLNDLAETMAKDPSVVSRGLQKIAEASLVLEKIRGRWEITPLGREMNSATKDFLGKQQNILKTSLKTPAKKSSVSENSILIVINAQCGLLDSTQLGRNNSEAEKNISRLLSHWRMKNRVVIHVKHVSDNPGSIYHRSSKSCDFLPGLEPTPQEFIIEKNHSSAFHQTMLEEKLKKFESADLILTGFTANECIDATARDAAALGFTTHVIGDATAMFDLKTPAGKWIKADRLHRLTLANLNAFYAQVLQTMDLVD